MPQHVNRFFGQMNQDDDPRYIGEGDYVAATNCDNSLSGVMANIRGTLEILLPNLPSGVNTVIHTTEDKDNAASIIFIHNSLGTHIIYKYFHVTGVVVEVCRGQILDFDKDRRISASMLIGGKDLYWVDGRSYGGALAGTYPKHLNVDRAIIKDKHLSYAIYPGAPGEGQFANGETYTVAVRDLSLAVLETVTFTADGTYHNNPIDGLRWLKAQIEASTLNDDVILELCECSLEITIVNVDRRISVTDSNGDIFLTELNHYPPTLRREHIDWMRIPPPVAPVATYIGQGTTPFNLVERGCFQFRVRYNYFGGQHSAWGPVSNVALNLDQATGEILSNLNAILVDFTDTFLVAENGGLDVVESVDLAVRDGNDAPFRMVDTIPACKLGVLSNKYVFTNNKVFPVVPSDDQSSTVAGAQVLKLFDALPIKAASLGTATDGSGSTRAYMGNIEDGYPCDDCVEGYVDYVPATDITSGLFDIVGKVRVVNNDLSETNSPKDFVVYLAGHPLWARTDDMGMFRIRNVPKGKYILRVATRFCRYDDTNGTRLNLNNGLIWQTTSACTLDVAGSVAAGNGYAERILDLTAYAGGTLDLQVAAGYGDIILQGVDDTLLDPEIIMEVYYFDNFGSATGDVQGIERHLLYIGSSGFRTDHNGHAFKVTTVGNLPGQGIAADNNLATSLGAMTFPSEGAGSFLFNTSAAWSAIHRKKITGLVRSQANVGVAGAVVNYRRGKFAVTKYDGSFEFPYFSVDPTGIRTDDELWTTYRNDSKWEFPPTPFTVTPNNNPLADYFFDVHFPFDIATSGPQIRALKHSGSYSVGVIYEDWGNRTCGANHLGNLQIPGVLEYGELSKLSGRWHISSQPPEWATHFRIVRTKDGTHNGYIYYAPNQIRYVKMFNLKTAPAATTYAAGDATHILVRVNPTLDKTTGDIITQFYQENKTGYFPEEGDRMRLLFNPAGAPVDTRTVEVQVLGHYLDGADFFVVVDIPEIPVEVQAGCLVEFYSPKRVNDGIYYEFGQRYRVIDPGTPLRRHDGDTPQVLGTTPASGIMQTGDTYCRTQLFDNGAGSFYARICEYDTKDDFAISKCEDIGRAFSLAKTGTPHKPNMVRWSGVYIPGATADNLNTFGAFDYSFINTDYGHIMWLGMVHSSMLVVCQHKSQPVYIGKGEMIDLSGETTVGRTSNIFNIADETVHDYGTHHPESIVVEDGFLYAWDAFRGIPWTFSQGGSQDIYAKMTTYFRQKGRERWKATRLSDRVLGGFDRERNQYHLTFSGGNFPMGDGGIVTLVGTTIVFNKEKRGWTHFISYEPICYGKTGNRMLVFSNLTNTCKAWLAYESFLYDNLFGVQGVSTVRFIAAPEGHLIKLWRNFMFRAKTKWYLQNIEGNPGQSYLRQQSKVPRNNIRRLENAWAGQFLRDFTDNAKEFRNIASLVVRQNTALLRGRELRGEWLAITLDLIDPQIQSNLSSFTTEFVLSEKTI